MMCMCIKDVMYETDLLSLNEWTIPYSKEDLVRDIFGKDGNNTSVVKDIEWPKLTLRVYSFIVMSAITMK